MRVLLQLSATLEKQHPSGPLDFEGGTLGEALTAFGLDLDEVGFVLRNGVKCELEETVAEGDVLKVLPPIIAG